MSEKTLNFLAKVESWNFKHKWVNFLFAVLMVFAYYILSIFLYYETCPTPEAGPNVIVFAFGTGIISFLCFLGFLGSIITAFRKKKYGDQLIRLFVVSFSALWSFIYGIFSGVEFYQPMIGNDFLLKIIYYTMIIVTGFIGYMVGKKAVAKLKEKGYSN